MNKINIEDLEKIKKKIPELINNEEAEAIISHVLAIKTGKCPCVDDKLANEILKNSTKSSNEFISCKKKIKFIDLFAGIGGFHSAFETLGCSCVFASELDKYAKQTYLTNYGIYPYGDINKIKVEEIPDHDILCAGFPCQPFSIAGVSKKNSMGLPTGFQDKARGNLFFNVRDVIKEKRPKAFFLENVKNLLSHDKGRTWKIIKATLEEELEYKIFYSIVDGKNWVPQHRERIFIVGFDSKLKFDLTSFFIPQKPILGSCYRYLPLSEIIKPENEVDEKYTLGIGTWKALQSHKERHKAKGNGFGYTLLPKNLKNTTITSTISARYYKDGAEILIPQNNGKRPRKLTVDEAMQLQGFNPKTFIIPVSNNQAYKQIGNSVVVPAIKDTAEQILKVLKK